MNNDIYLIGEVGWEITLENVIKAVNESDSTKPLNIYIHSQGGSVYDGLAIYNYLKGLEQEVNTISSGLVASIASIFFLAGNKETRKVNSTDSFLIHLPMGGSFGNAQDMEKTANELRDIEDKLATIYENETNLTKEEALDLMNKDEMLPVDFLLEKGFVSEVIEFKAVAKFNNNNKMSETLTKKDAEGLFEKFFNKFFKKASVNKVLQDANGTELDFTNLASTDDINVGDEAMVNGSKATGEYVMPSGETYKFENGVLNEIIEAETEEEKDLEAIMAENESLKNELHSNSETIQEKDTKIESLEARIEEIKNEFSELKNQITSNFDYDKKDKTKQEPVNNTGSRKLFKD